MSFRATNIVPHTAYNTVKAAAVQLKTNIDSIVLHLAANNATYEYLRGIYQTLVRADNQFEALKTTPGLAEYAAAQENDPNYDVVVEFVAMQDAIASAKTWMQTNVPLSVTLRPMMNWDDGSLISTEFTPMETADFRTVLSAVSAAIA